MSTFPKRSSGSSDPSSPSSRSPDGRQLPKSAFSNRRPGHTLNRNRVVALVVIAAALLLPIGWFYFFAAADKSAATKAEKITDQHASFFALLSDGTGTQLINEYNRLETSPDTALPIVMDNLRNRIAIADRLLEFTNDKKDLEFGTLGKIRALSQLHQVSVTNDIEDVALTRRLLQLANDNLDHPNKEIANNALLALTLNSVVEFAKNPESADFSDTLNRFQECATKSVEDSNIAHVLFRSAAWLGEENLNLQAAELYRVLYQSLESSTKKELKTLSDLAQDEFISIQFNIDDIKDEIESYASPQLVAEKIQKVISSQQMVSGGLARLVPLIDMMVARSQIAEAKELASQMQKRLGSNNSEQDRDLQLSITQLQARIDAFGETFDFGGLQTIGQEFDLNHRNNPALVLLWKLDEPESRDNLIKLNDRMAGYLDQQGLDIIAVGVSDENDDETETNRQLNQFSLEMPKITFVLAPEHSDVGKEFHQRFPVPKYPFVLVLGNANEVRLINPPSYDFKSKLDKIIGEYESN